jgi:cellulose synthase (UDP-forming)
MNIRRIRHARLQMRILGRRKGFAFAVKAVRELAGWRGWQDPLVIAVVLVASLPMLWLTATIKLTVWQQLAFAVMSFGAAMFMRLLPGRYVTQVLIVLSVLVSTRYLYWRATETISFDSWLNGLFGSLLFLAELYAWIVLIFGYFQTAWPLERKPVPMDPDTSTWPTVDVLIPTYNEPLKVVRTTVFAAMAMDWPRDKLRVYILDDGKREDFRQFAEEVGVGYLTRSVKKHAKAGNLNAALRHVKGEYVAIFDCDHVPTRTFLQVSMGWFGKDPKLAMVQTPHHFFSPDPLRKPGYLQEGAQRRRVVLRVGARRQRSLERHFFLRILRCHEAVCAGRRRWRGHRNCDRGRPYCAQDAPQGLLDCLLGRATGGWICH